MSEEMINKQYAINQVRGMAFQFADLYFEFAKQLRDELGEEKALEITQKVLFTRAKERALGMVKRAEEQNVPRTPQNIKTVGDVSYLGWQLSMGKDHCPYGVAWNKRIEENPWFQKFACLYCDVTDTTIGEVFTGTHSHKLYKNVVLGDCTCEREYFLSHNVENNKLTYGK